MNFHHQAGACPATELKMAEVTRRRHDAFRAAEEAAIYQAEHQRLLLVNPQPSHLTNRSPSQATSHAARREPDDDSISLSIINIVFSLRARFDGSFELLLFHDVKPMPWLLSLPLTAEEWDTLLVSAEQPLNLAYTAEKSQNTGHHIYLQRRDFRLDVEQHGHGKHAIFVTHDEPLGRSVMVWIQPTDRLAQMLPEEVHS